MRKKLFVLLCIMLCLSMASMVSYATLSDLKSRQKTLNDKISEERQKIRNINKEKDSVSRQINNLDEQMEVASLELKGVEADIQQLNVNIEITEKKLAETEENLAENLDLFAERVNVLYKMPRYSNLELLLNAKNLQDYLSRRTVIHAIAEQDAKLVENIKIEKATVEENKMLLNRQRETAKHKQLELEGKKRTLVAATREKKNYMQRLEQNAKELENNLNQFNQAARDLTAKIKQLQSKNSKYTGGKLTWPVPGHYSISSPYGYRKHPILKKRMFHSGTDIPAPEGTSIVAAADGKVIYSAWLSSYGKAVMIDHGGGIVTLYGHNSSLSVGVGTMVKRGQRVALCGSTGRSTGPHCHFEVRKNGEFQDPMSWFQK